MIASQNTSHTLLRRALDVGDEEAWEQLVTHYRRFIFYVLNELGAAPADIEDICQQVLVALLRDLRNYDRTKGRFRTWLSAIIRNTAISHFRKQDSRRRRLDSLRQQTVLDSLERNSGIDAYIEREWTTYIATQAMARVRDVFQGKAVEVFELGLDGVAAADVAERTHLTVATVYTLRKRVKKRLCQEILELVAELEP